MPLDNLLGYPKLKRKYHNGINLYHVVCRIGQHFLRRKSIRHVFGTICFNSVYYDLLGTT